MILKRMGCREIDFDYDTFAAFLCGSDRIITEHGKRFYVGTVREKINGHESKLAMSNQTSLFTKLSAEGWCIKTSKLRTRMERIRIDDRVKDYKKLLDIGMNEIFYERSREKGIDVKLAIDLIVACVDDKYDTAIIVSSDTDLVPAVQWVRGRQEKRVEYIGFSVAATDQHEAVRPVKTMIYNTDVQRVLSEADMRQFIKSKLL